MPRHSAHHHGSDPEDRFDHWLDALVPGTPAGEASREDDTGRLARAQAGARQLHGLAAQSAMPGAAAQRRIEEDLMHSGTLAAPSGSMWIPNRRQERRVPWWSPASPVLATALAIAVIVALVGSLIWTQRPAPSSTPEDTPGLAMASPDLTLTSPSAHQQLPGASLPIVKGEPGEELRSRLGTYGMIDDHGLTIIRTGEDDLEFSGTTSARPNGVPGEAVLTRDDGTRSVVDLTTGETRFNLPGVSANESQAGTYLFVSKSGGNADWTIWDLRTGESRPLPEIVDLPADRPVVPVSFGQLGETSTTVFLQFITPRSETRNADDISAFVIAGSLDRATTLDGYPPMSQNRSSLPVVSPDGSTVAWVATEPANAIVVADSATGEKLARFDIEVLDPSLQIAGFTSDGERLILMTADSVLSLGWPEGEPEEQTVAEGMNGASSPIYYAPTDTLYYVQSESLLSMTIPDGRATTVFDGVSSSYAPKITKPGSPWIVVNLNRDTVLIDARTGAVVSQVQNRSVQSDPYRRAGLATSDDGSTAVQMVGGSGIGYLVSPRFPDGLVLTPPIDPATIEGSNSQGSIPVNYTLSPYGDTVLAMTIAEGDVKSSFIAEIDPNLAWTPIGDGVEQLSWLPMSETQGESSTPETLPAQDFAPPLATPAATPAATPEAVSAPAAMFVIDGNDELARIEGDVAFAMLGEDGLTLPIPNDAPVTIPGVTGTDQTTSKPGQLVVYRENQPPAVIDLATGDILFELPGFQTWGQDLGRWYMVPTDDTLTDWIIADVVTGETHILSEIVGLPGDESVMPIPAVNSYFVGDTHVFEVQPGSPENLRWTPSGPPVATFVIGGSLDRLVEIAGFPTAQDRVGSPPMVAGGEGRFIAYETRVDNARIVVVDTTTGEELARYGAETVGEDPTLAGFLGDTQTLIITSGDRVMTLSHQGGEIEVVRDGLEGIAHPLLYPGEAMLYFTQVDAVMRLSLQDGELTKIATGFVPGGISFTRREGSDWILFQTQGGVTLVDATSGEIASQMKLPGARGGFPAAEETPPWWTDADGDTVIIGMERQGRSSSGVPGAVWLLSPEFPNGLEITGPSREHPIVDAFLSPDGSTLYASTSESVSGPDDLWATPLGEEPAWELIAEDVSETTFLPLGQEE